MTGPARGLLVVVATPIGNLGDLSPRATEVLRAADVVCCEDTRRTRTLLSAFGLPASPRRLVSVHAHNEAARVASVLWWLGQGKTVALVSDAGTPTISDPGGRVVAAAAAAGYAVSSVPGPSSVMMALTLSGLPADRFCVEGFLPRRGAERRRRLAGLAVEERTMVVLEAPGRLAALLVDLRVACGDRRVAVCRELTKVHEEVWRGSLDDAVGAFESAEVLGEVVVVLEGSAPAGPDQHRMAEAVRARLEAGDTPREAAESVAEALGVAKRSAYREALGQRDAAAPPSSGVPEDRPPGGPAGRR